MNEYLNLEKFFCLNNYNSNDSLNDICNYDSNDILNDVYDSNDVHDSNDKQNNDSNDIRKNDSNDIESNDSNDIQNYCSNDFQNYFLNDKQNDDMNIESFSDLNDRQNIEFNDKSKYKNDNINQSQILTQIKDIPNQNGFVNKPYINIINVNKKNKETSLKKVKDKLSFPEPISNETNSKTTILTKELKKNKYKKKFPNKKYGRISKANKANGKKGKHTKNNVDNLKKKVFTHCTRNIDVCIRNYIKAKKYKMKLIKPTITPQMGNKKDIDLQNLSNKTIKDIYLHSKPKRYSKDYDKKLKKNIETLVQKEEILKIIFNKKLRDFLLMYLYDYTFLHCFEGIFEGFKTYKNELDDIDKDTNKKKRHKKNILNLLENKK